MQSKAKTVEIYLKELPRERRTAVETVRKSILKNLPKGYKEVMQYGMIGYVVPLKLYPDGYLNDKKTPLPYVALASQKNDMAVYLMCNYGDKEAEKKFRVVYQQSGKRLNMGKSCVRFKKLEDLSLEAIGLGVSMTPVKTFIAKYEKGRNSRIRKS